MRDRFKFGLLAVLLIAFSQLKAQSTYTLANYASNGDTIYLTQAQINLANFDTTGVGITWNYASLTGNGQTTLVFRVPNQSGFTAFEWPYIYNQNNVNLSSTNGQTISIGNYEETNPNDYYLLGQNALQQKASSFDVVIDGFSFSIKNVYTSPDYIYRFPLNYQNTDTSDATYSTNIPGVYYSQTQLKRMDTVTGWGTVITPYGTFTNALKLESVVNEQDSLVFNDTNSQVIHTTSREFQWLDPSKTYPVLDVKQILTGNTYITESIQYFDRQEYYQPSARFAYLPLQPVIGDTVTFQNLSTNSNNFNWNFGDANSGSNDSSNLANPIHIFNAQGVYKVTLIAVNGPLRDTVSENITVADTGTVTPVAYFTYSPAQPAIADTVTFQNLSTNGSNYLWNFGDASSGVNNISIAINPIHIFSAAGVYKVTLIASNDLLSDTTSENITIADTGAVTPVAYFTYSPAQPVIADTVTFQNLSTNGSNYLWNFGDTSSGVNNISVAANPIHIYGAAGVYTVTLIAGNDLLSDTTSENITIADTAVATPVTVVQPNNFSVYPNPGNGFVNVNTNIPEPYSITVFDLQGRQLLYEAGCSGLHTLDVRSLTTGVYAVRLQTGGAVYNVKLLVDGR